MTAIRHWHPVSSDPYLGTRIRRRHGCLLGSHHHLNKEQYCLPPINNSLKLLREKRLWDKRPECLIGNISTWKPRQSEMINPCNSNYHYSFFLLYCFICITIEFSKKYFSLSHGKKGTTIFWILTKVRNKCLSHLIFILTHFNKLGFTQISSTKIIQ